MYYFLAEDYKDLEDQLKKAKKNVADALKQIGESARQDPGNTFHDNFGFEEGNRQYQIWSVESEKIELIKNQAKIIKPNNNTGKIELGKTVKIQDQKTGKINKFQIRGFMVAPKKQAVSYLSPLGKILMGAKLGKVCKGKIAGENKRFKILEIK